MKKLFTIETFLELIGEDEETKNVELKIAQFSDDTPLFTINYPEVRNYLRKQLREKVKNL